MELDKATDLAVSIPDSEGRPCSGRLLDISGYGAGARFLAAECPTLAIGQVVKLIFTSERLKNPVTATARVQNRTEEEDSRRYGFRFLEGEKLDAQLPPALRKLFNRRQAVRVAPDPDLPVPVTMEAEEHGPRVEGRLADLSSLGAGASLDSEAESGLAETSRVGISLVLPSILPTHLIGDIRHRRLIGAEIRYGVEFDPERSENFARQQDLITRYVMERQRALLRTAARMR